MNESRSDKERKKTIIMIAFTGIHPIDTGGPAQVGFNIARELIRNGFKLELIFKGNSSHVSKIHEEIQEELHKNIQLIPIESFNRLPSSWNPIDLISQIRLILSSIRANREGIVIYNSPPFDLITLCPFFSRIVGCKQIFILHGGIFNENQGLIKKILICLQLRFIDKIIVLSDYFREIAVQNGFPSNLISQIPNGIDRIELSEIRELNLVGNPKILFVGRLAKIKGVDALIKSMTLILRDFPNAHLYIVGEGPESDNLKRLTLETGLTNHITFEGEKLPGIQTRSYYYQSDIFVLSSISENFPMVILEALSAGIPIVSSDIPGGVRELLTTNDLGWLIPVGSSEMMAQAISTVAKLNPNRRREIHDKEIEIAIRYDWHEIGKMYIDLMDELMNDKKI